MIFGLDGPVRLGNGKEDLQIYREFNTFRIYSYEGTMVKLVVPNTDCKFCYRTQCTNTPKFFRAIL